MHKPILSLEHGSFWNSRDLSFDKYGSKLQGDRVVAMASQCDDMS